MVVSASKASEQRLFLASALAILVLCFAGFARNYYLRMWLGGRVLSPLLHVHGLVMTAWILLFTMQVLFVVRHRIDLHKKLGIVGAVLAGCVIALGSVIIVRDIAKQSPDASTASFWALFAAFDGINLALFGGLIVAGFLLRRHPDVHKRLMLVATLCLLPPALGRIAIHFVAEDSEPITKLAMLIGVVAGIVCVDTFRQRRLHPALGWGLALLLCINGATYFAQIST